MTGALWAAAFFVWMFVLLILLDRRDDAANDRRTWSDADE
jgi:hypothetical protein